MDADKQNEHGNEELRHETKESHKRLREILFQRCLTHLTYLAYIFAVYVSAIILETLLFGVITLTSSKTIAKYDIVGQIAMFVTIAVAIVTLSTGFVHFIIGTWKLLRFDWTEGIG